MKTVYKVTYQNHVYEITPKMCVCESGPVFERERCTAL